MIQLIRRFSPLPFTAFLVGVLLLGTPAPADAQSSVSCSGGTNQTITEGESTTLTGDCTLSGELDLYDSSTVIDGNGFTITAAPDKRHIRVSRATLDIKNATLVGGAPVSDDPFMPEALGGAIDNSRGTVTVTNCTFQNNESKGDGGAISNYRGTLTVISSAFVSNHAREYEDDMGMTMYGRGGAIFNRTDDVDQALTVINSVFASNEASGDGGAIFNRFGETPETVTVTNSTFSGNTVGMDGGAINNSGGDMTLNNVIMAGTTGGEADCENSGTVTFGAGTSTLIETDDSSSPCDENGSNAIAGPPQFADASTPAGADGAFGTSDDGLRLTAGSPALGRGTYDPFAPGGVAENITTDLVGNDRRFGLKPDLGAYEFSTVASINTDIPEAGGLVGYLTPSNFTGTILLRTNPATSGGLSFERLDEIPSGAGLPSGVAPYTWTVTSDLDADPSYDFILETDDVPGITDFQSLMIYKSEDGGQTWDPIDVEGTIVRQEGRNLLAAEGLSGFSQFAIGSGSDGLPVELVRFRAQRAGDTALLRWQTASEQNNAGFEVQHRQESGTWKNIGFVEGAGTTTSTQHYRYRARTLDPGTHRFRLRQIDTDGRSEWSQEIELSIGLDQAYHVSTPYPNPAHNQATIDLIVREAQHVRATLHDALGREVAVLYDDRLSGNQPKHLRIDGRRMTSGAYFLRVVGTNFSVTRHVTLTR